MMPKTILVPLTGSAAGSDALAAAFGLARHGHGHLVALHVRVDPRDAVFMASEAASAQVIDSLIAAAEADAARREGISRAAFDTQLLAARGADPRAPAPSARFVSETGTEADIIGTYGRSADLIVAPRPKPGRPAERDDIALEAALFDTGRAVLLPGDPPIEAPTSHIAIAWNDSPQAARAVAGAMPFLTRTGRCTILAAEETGELKASADRLAANLLHHGVAATVEILDARRTPASEVLDRRVKELGISLLVMGAYGHSRLREWVLGGVTRHRLATAGPALLLAH